jgi:hypothetical protein
MENKTKRYLLCVSRTFVIWVGEALGLPLLIHFVPGLSVKPLYLRAHKNAAV